MQAFAQIHSAADTDSREDSFTAMPRNCDTAVVYWNLPKSGRPEHSGCRLCLFVKGVDSEVDETIILHRDSGHFIVPLLADERKYEMTLGWSDSEGFRPIRSQRVELPKYPSQNLGAMSSSLSYRGSHFWPKKCDTTVN